MSMSILVFTGFYLPGYKGGGPIKTIANLIGHSGKKIDYSVVTSDRDLGDIRPYSEVQPGEWNQFLDIPVFYSQPSVKGLLQILKLLVKSKCDVVYLNSFLAIRFSFFPLVVSKLLGMKVVLAPRGEFSEGALAIKARKKKAFIAMYKLLRLYKGVVFQASSPFEAEDIRQALGNDVDIKIAGNISSQDFTTVLQPQSEGALRAVFISRISPKKNLLAAIEVLAKVKMPIIYDIYGPIEDQSYWESCQRKIKALPENIQVNYRGSLTPQNVVHTITNYDIFFFLTKGENYGHVIAEALSAGLPLLISDTTPWRGLQEKGLGWDLSLANLLSFVSVFEDLAAMPTEEHLNMRENVLAWAKREFSQQDVIEANIEMFRYAHERK